MSCWVVPAIAAELWGVTVGHVLAGIRDGSIAARHDHGFVFVDAAPATFTYRRPGSHHEPPPPTFVLVGAAGDDEPGPRDEGEDAAHLPRSAAGRAAVARRRRPPVAA